MTTTNDLSTWHNTIMATYGTPAMVLEKGQGSTVWDVDGKKYIDFLAGIAVNVVGHAHPAIVEAVSTQVATLGHTSNFAAHPQVLALAEKLVALTDPSARVFFCNSGAEANEAAIKMSRRTGRTHIVSLNGAFHGRTTGALTVTGQPAKYEPFLPLLPDVTFIEPNDVEALRSAITSDTAALWIEPILGEGGVIPLTDEFIQVAREVCSATGALFVVDEVQTGIGRTGTMFAYEQFNVLPDVLLLAKGLGGGLPIGACIGFGNAATLLTAGQHGTTYGGNPISTAAANAVLELVESENLATRALTQEAIIRDALEPLTQVVEIRGRGLMLGVVLKGDFGADVVTHARALGLITNSPASNVLRLVPPLNISDQELAEGLAILQQAVQLAGGPQ